jgi:hypothetical protein
VSIRIVDRSAIIALGRLEANAGQAIRRGLLKGGLAVGRAVSQYAPWLTRRLQRSFLVPVMAGPFAVLIGKGAPIYAAIQNYGGTIEGRPWLVFDIGGETVFAHQVTIEGKHFAEQGIAAAGPKVPYLIAGEIVKEFAA